MSKSKSGITLIALVITIIVLLILAGISISMLSGDNSILSKAGEARDIAGEKDIAERVQIAYLGALATGKGTVTEDKLKEELTKQFGEDGYELSQDLSKVTIPKGGKEYDVGGTVAEGGDSESGLTQQADGTYKDSSGNEWVWIEVPKTVTASATDDAGIYNALRDYCATDSSGNTLIAKTGSNSKTTTNGYTDEWYAWDTTNNAIITSSTATEEKKALKNGCGLSYSEYNTLKSTMLNSIKNSGGFYIGKYETGIDDSSIEETATTTAGLRTSPGETTQTAVIKQNMQPYTYVTCSQAETIAKGFATDGKTASLLFGIQWDLVLKFLSVEGVATNLLNNNSTTWGNYKNNTYNIENTSAWYSTNYGVNWTKGVYNKTASGSTLLTTGAHTDFSKQNIYDLAGNVREWTLEKSSFTGYPCAFRGGYCNDDGGSVPASRRLYGLTTDSGCSIGFRVSLY